MLYWSRTGSWIDLLLWFLLCLIWGIGGWLIISVFHLREREKLFTGIATGWLLFIVLTNFAAHVIPLTPAYWFSAMFILAAGIIAFSRFEQWKLDAFINTHNLKQIAVFGFVLLLFIQINRGLAIFDDYSNLPMIARIASGDFPPHFYLNPEVLIDYHYGLHLFSAGTVRIGGLFPWSAFDITKAFSLALFIMLAWLWFQRTIQNNLANLFGVLLILFAAGARWLLLFIPKNALITLGRSITLWGTAQATGQDLYHALISPWNIEGGGPIPFPFAFASGIFTPQNMALGGSASIAAMSISLLLLLAKRKWHWTTGILVSLVISSLAITGEHLYLMVLGGIFTVVAIGSLQRRSLKKAYTWGWVLLPSLLLGTVGGGVITQISRQFLIKIFGGTSTVGVGIHSLSLRFPPVIISAHFGELSLTNPNQILIAILEMGPVLFLAPWITWIGWKRIKYRHWLYSALIFGASIGFIGGLFLDLSMRNRDITRITSTALIIWLITSIPYIWLYIKQASFRIRLFFVTAYAITIFSGLALFIPQLIAIAAPVYSFYIDEPDAAISRIYWDEFNRDEKFLDPHYIYRPAVLFGTSTSQAFQDIYTPFPKFKILLDEFSPSAAAASGYDFLYIDKYYWTKLTGSQKAAFRKPCIRKIAEQRTPTNDFRRIYDIRSCR